MNELSRAALADELEKECKIRDRDPDDYDSDLTALLHKCVAALRAPLPPTLNSGAVQEILRKISGQAHAGAMLGGQNAYEACLAIEALVAALPRAVESEAMNK